MSVTRAKKRTATTPRRDIYDEVTQRVLSALAEGVVPWRRPWRVQANAYSDRHPHVNLASKKPYQRINTLLLDLAALSAGYRSPYWVTFRQALTLGGAVRRGEKSTLIVFWKQLTIPNDNRDPDQPQRRIPLLRHYNVFNTEQCDGLGERIPPPPPAPVAFTPIERAKALLEGMPGPPSVVHAGQRARYTPASDTVTLPPAHSFASAEAYYGTSFHEHVHATGHQSRLARPEITNLGAFASPSYSREELVAEMGAAFLCAIADIDLPALQTNTHAYIASWMSKLRDDPKLLVQAASRAQRAVDYILAA
jgi:antirestriction protein ArdC